MNWQSLASNAGLHRSNGSVVPDGPMNAAHDEILPSGSGFNSDVNTTGRPCLLYTSPSPRDKRQSRMPSSA